jgi:transcription elongation factor Elf1
MTKKPCTHEFLATSDTDAVLMCRECGVVYLHMQNMSLRFNVTQFSKFAAMMTEASKKLGADSAEQPRKRPTLTLVR